MNPDLHGLIERIHASPRKAVITVTGGGSSALAWLLSVPGASKYRDGGGSPLLSGRLLLSCWAGSPPKPSARRPPEAWRQVAYRRALSLRQDSTPVAGVACTAAIATDRPRRGGHRCHVAAWTADGVTTYGLRLRKGLRDRAGEEAVVGSLVVKALAGAFDLECQPSLDLDEAEGLVVESEACEDPLKALLAGHASSVTVGRDGVMEADGPVASALLPGSFNPLHDGHVDMAKVASEMLDSEVAYELSVVNVDKPPLGENEVRARCAQFEGLAPVVISRAPVFHEKARLFPGRTFVIGADTAERLVQPRYYDGSASRMLMALDETRRLGCRFLVSGRARDGAFRTLDDIPLPGEFAGMFSPIPEARFRSDASSTELRMAGRRS